MRRSLSLLAVTALVALTACSGSEKFSDAGSDGKILPVAKRQTAPVLSGKSLDGGTASTANGSGKVTLVNFWGSWCPPCQDEAPALAQVAKDTASTVDFLGIDTRDTTDGANNFRSKYGHSWPSIVDLDGSVSAKWTPLPPTSPPSTVILDKHGRVASRFIGGVTYAELTKVLSTLSAEQ